MTTIDKKDTTDLSMSIAEQVIETITRTCKEGGYPTTHQLAIVTQDILNSWISECETEEAEYRNYENKHEHPNYGGC